MVAYKRLNLRRGRLQDLAGKNLEFLIDDRLQGAGGGVDRSREVVAHRTSTVFH